MTVSSEIIEMHRNCREYSRFYSGGSIEILSTFDSQPYGAACVRIADIGRKLNVPGYKKPLAANLVM